MPLSVKCECGSQLEIDEKFLGKEILCPDCQRPLPTKAPAAPPPLDLPDHRRTSGLALLSLTLAIVGFISFFVGNIAAIVVGILALRKIARHPNRYEGAGLARAGVITAAVGIPVTLLMLIFSLVPVDACMRDLLYAGRMHYPQAVNVDRETISIPRPSGAWGVYTSPTQGVPPKFERDELILINTSANAYMSFQKSPLAGEDGNRKKALERLQKSELLSMLGNMRGEQFPADRIPFEEKKDEKKDDKNANEKEFTFDMHVGRHERRFLVRFESKDKNWLNVCVAVTPVGSFESMKKEILETFDKAKFK